MATTTSETLAVEGGELPLTVSRGEEVGPAVVIVPSIFGVSPDLVEQMEEIADGGALVVAMDPFFRDQPGPMSYGDPPAAIARMGRIEVEASYRDFRALVEHARPRSNGKVIGVGICFGGPFCFMAAADGALAGVVTWHGSRLDQFLDGAATIRCAVRLHFGDADPVVRWRRSRRSKRRSRITRTPSSRCTRGRATASAIAPLRCTILQPRRPGWRPCTSS